MTTKNRNRVAAEKRMASLSVAKRKTVDLPPDPDGYFTMMAGRAKKVLATYDSLPNDFAWNEIVGFLMLDLMHLCDRNPRLGGVHKAYVWANDMYDRLVEENYQMEETQRLQ